MELYRRSGYAVASVESFIPGDPPRKRDLFGAFDLLAVSARRQPSVVLIQVTTVGHLGDRLRKVKASPATPIVIAAGIAVEVHGWARRGRQWTVKRIAVTGDDLADVIVEAPKRRRPQLNQMELFA